MQFIFIINRCHMRKYTPIYMVDYAYYYSI